MKITDLYDTVVPMIMTIYGDSGTGKTSFIATCPKPLLLIDINEKGTDSLKVPEVKKGDIDVVSVTKFEEIFDVYNYIYDNQSKYKTIAIDHMSALQELARTHIKEEQRAKRLTQQLHGFVVEEMTKVIYIYKTLADKGLNLIFIAQARTDIKNPDTDESLTEPNIRPSLSPSLYTLLVSTSRVVGYTHVRTRYTLVGTTSKVKIDYVMQLTPTSGITAKLTMPKHMPRLNNIINPSYAKLTAILEGKLKKRKK